jgi:ABC-type transport system involved in multi-copper enzyme maturation permease subunit
VVWVTFLEGVRNKAAYGITLLAGLMMVFTVLLSSLIMQDVGKVATDLALSTATFAALLVVLFVGINILARDLERKTVYLAMSRAVPRSRYIIARFLGLGMLQGMIMVLLLCASLVTILAVRQMYPVYSGMVSLQLVAVAHLFIYLQMLLLTTLSMLYSMVASTSFVTFLLTTITWLIGSSTQEVKRLVESDATLQIAPVTKIIVKAAYYLFPNLALFDLKTNAAHGIAVDLSHLGFIVLYGAGYAVAVLSLTVLLFRRKELN